MRFFETAESKAELEVAKRRARFKLSMIGIKPGTELQLAKDPAVVCRTYDEENKIDFRGDITTLSDAALQAVNEMAYSIRALGMDVSR